MIIESVVVADFAIQALNGLTLTFFNNAPIEYTASTQPIPFTIIIIDDDMRILPSGLYKTCEISSKRFDR